jgi:hypothetical protein
MIETLACLNPVLAKAKIALTECTKQKQCDFELFFDDNKGHIRILTSFDQSVNIDHSAPNGAVITDHSRVTSESQLQASFAHLYPWRKWFSWYRKTQNQNDHNSGKLKQKEKNPYRETLIFDINIITGTFKSIVVEV